MICARFSILATRGGRGWTREEGVKQNNITKMIPKWKTWNDTKMKNMKQQANKESINKRRKFHLNERNIHDHRFHGMPFTKAS